MTAKARFLRKKGPIFEQEEEAFRVESASQAKRPSIL